jgi:hypothetical protein
MITTLKNLLLFTFLFAITSENADSQPQPPGPSRPSYVLIEHFGFVPMPRCPVGYEEDYSQLMTTIIGYGYGETEAEAQQNGLMQCQTYGPILSTELLEFKESCEERSNNHLYHRQAGYCNGVTDCVFDTSIGLWKCTVRHLEWPICCVKSM